MFKKNVVAIDLGASSGRLISGSFDGKSICLKEQFRFSNQPINLLGSLYWDYLKIFQEIKYGLSIAEKDLKEIASMSVDTWGVDYGYIDHLGKVINTPYSYRDSRASEHQKMLEEQLSSKKIFFETGVQPDVIDSIMQLFADLVERPYLRKEIQHILFMPNLIEYFFSGKKVNEFTIASTSGLLDKKTREVSPTIFDELSFQSSWFGKIQKEGKVLGKVLPQIQEELGLKSEIDVISGIGHDTAAAVQALPIKKENLSETAFLSCGTWSIVGMKTKEPIVNAKVYYDGLTNEGCYGGNNRLLKNITGLWIIQELQKEWSNQGKMIDFDTMVDMAEAVGFTSSYINPNCSTFAAPGNMEQKIINFIKETGQHVPESRGELLRIVYESLALSYARTIQILEDNTGHVAKTIYMFGGGIQNTLLVNLTANYTQKNIQTGPVEASVMGNVVGQLLTMRMIQEQDRVEILRNSFVSRTIQPQVNVHDIQKAQSTFEIISKID